MQSFADLSTNLSARDCRDTSGKILPRISLCFLEPVPRSAVQLFKQNVNALISHYQDAHPDLTLADIAKQMGVSLRTISNARTGSHAATLETVQKIADFFELDTWQLFMEDLPTSILLNPRLAKLVRNVVRVTVQDQVEEYAERVTSIR